MNIVHAQTGFGLLIQAKRAGLDMESLRLLAAAHQMAAEHFAGVYRPGWKPFICHLCGVSSAALRHKAGTPYIVAAMLHSIYVIGKRPEREFVRSRIGAESEMVVYSYEQTKRASLDRDDLSATERKLLLLRLCDVFDDLWDGGHAFAPAKGLWLGLPKSGRSRVEQLAARSGAPKLADEFKALLASLDELGELPVIDRVHKHSFQAVNRPRLIDYLTGKHLV